MIFNGPLRRRHLSVPAVGRVSLCGRSAMVERGRTEKEKNEGLISFSLLSCCGRRSVIAAARMGAHSQKRSPFSLLTPNKQAQKDTVDGRDGAGLNEPSSRNECTNRQVHGGVSSRVNCAIMQACLLCSCRPQLNS